MSLRSDHGVIKQRDVDEAQERASKSEQKMWQITRDQQDLREQLDKCERDVEHFADQLRHGRWQNTQERVRLEDMYKMARRHETHLEEQYERGRGKLNSARATYNRLSEEYDELEDRFFRQEDRHKDWAQRERQKEYDQIFEAQRRHGRRPSHAFETGSSQTWSKVYSFETKHGRKSRQSGESSQKPRRPSRPDSHQAHYEQESRRTYSKHAPHYSNDQQHPPRSSDRQSRPQMSSRTPSDQTVTSWRKFVDDCFRDYASMKEFPHPPIPGRRDDPTAWGEELKALFRKLQVNVKKESFRWHPDKFSPCDSSKKEKFQQYAQEVFVVLNAMVEEEKQNK